ncbi:MAG: hypothetical protein DYG89_45930 [Caldilinea sp. CFX5]|nr:hypothetical protein [Caldilinea sp. CFX5]
MKIYATAHATFFTALTVLLLLAGCQSRPVVNPPVAQAKPTPVTTLTAYPNYCVFANSMACVAWSTFRCGARQPIRRLALILTGSESLTYAEATAQIGAVIGKEVYYINQTLDEAWASMAAIGLRDPYLHDLIELYRLFGASYGAAGHCD